MPKISIIIPIYNVEKYIEECLSSVRQQTYSDFEVIMVDDGSKDGSAVICKKYAAADPRFVYIHKENAGVSSARNKGLEEAHGEYVSFIDADDWVEKDYLESFMNCTPIADITFFGETTHDVDGTETSKLPRSIYADNRTDIEKSIYYLKCGDLGDILGWTWDKFFSLKIIKKYNIHFEESVSFREDELFALEYCRYIGSLRIIDKILYNYRIVPGGLTKRGLKKNDLLPSSQHLIEDLGYYAHDGLCEHILKSATDYRAMNIYKSPIKHISTLLRDYKDMAENYPQLEIECRRNNLTKYLSKGFWMGYLYCMIRKI